VRSGVRHQGPLPPDLLYWPIRWRNNEKLFQHLNGVGERVYTTFYFSPNFKDYFAGAQFELQELYRRILRAIALAQGFLLYGLDRPQLTELQVDIDAILVKSTYFIEALKTYPLFLDALGKSIGKREEGLSFVLLVGAQLEAIAKIKAAMFQPETCMELIPYRKPCLMAAVFTPIAEGQKFLNGVYFKPGILARLNEADGRSRRGCVR
jgi:hypothetical protein